MNSVSPRPGMASAIPAIVVGLCGVLLTACGISMALGTDSPGPLVLLSPTRWDRAAALVFIGLGLLILAWWLFSLLIGLLAELLGRRGHHHAAARAARCSPAFMRRLAAVLLGAHLLVIPAAQAAAPGGTGLPATTTPPTSAVSWSVPAAGAELPAASWGNSELPSPAWSPERPAAPLNRLMGQRTRTETRESVVVEAGDTLWSIAARSAGPGATDAEIARAWPRWYRINRAAIGPDPDMLDIGTVLTPPRAEQDQNRR